MKEVKPLEIVNTNNQVSIFLAGSIDMGTAVDWQAQVVEAFKDCEGVLLNPRRDNWDPSWEQTADNPDFTAQVIWELSGLDQADHIVVYFDPNSKAPVSLLELGLYANTGKVRVVCPDGYWRKGNVEVVCMRHKVHLYPSLEYWIQDMKDVYFTNGN